MKKFLAAFVLCAAALAQINTAPISGSVTDPSGAGVPGAEVQVINVATSQAVKTTTNEKGEFAVPSMLAGTYKVTVTRTGFKAVSVDGVVVNAGVPATVTINLEIGQTTEVVQVTAGAEILQTTSAAVSSTIGGRQLFELPFATRNAVELLVTQPGVQTPTNPRSSSINGLPRGALNITIDGMNTQDNLGKSGDGFYSFIFPTVDALEELTLTTSAGGAESTGQGAAQIKFITKGGSNQFHGGGFYQKRQTGWNANYYFNNRDGLARDVVNMTQRGLHGGGPIKKDRAFFFVNYEQYKLPGTKSYDRVILGEKARNGIFTYLPSGTTVPREVNLYTLAGSAGFPTTPDPILDKTFAAIAATKSGGIVTPRIATNNDYNRETLSYQPTGKQMRHFFTTRLDGNLTTNHHLSLVYNYDKYDSTPDFLNNVVAAFPGTGTVLGSDVNTGQRSNRFAGMLSLRSQFGGRLTNEWRGGLNSGTTLFFDALNPGLFATWRGFRPLLGFGLANVSTGTSAERRNYPVKEFADNVHVIKGSHQLAIGGTFTQINLFQQIAGTDTMPTITFGFAAGDPIQTGPTSIFNATNFPNSSSTQQNDARDLYATLTGRVSAISRQLTLDEKTKQYGAVPRVNRNRMREYGLYAQDTWRVKRNLTINLGLRWEKQGAYENLNGTYSRVGLDSLWGLSGVGNLFKPGTLTGVTPSFTAGAGDAYKIPSVWAPSAGLAWQLPKMEGFLGKLFGSREGASVLRAGYAISTVREGQSLFTAIWGSNQGLTQTASISPITTPLDFGTPGSVLFRDNIPTKSGLLASPVYPIPASFTTSLNDFLPNLKLGYVQSWNIGWQRELGRNMVVEARFTGNHGVHLWRQYDLDETNIVENGFRNEFLIAQNNLRIARSGDITRNTTVTNYGNTGLAGQQNIPILQTAVGNTTDATIGSHLLVGSAGAAAQTIATNATRLGNLTAGNSTACGGARCPINLFQVNPTVSGSGGGAFVVDNNGSSYYDALQIELRRRLSAGLTLQGSYVFSKSLTNGPVNSGSSFSQPTTLRNLGLDKVPSIYDIRQAIKANWTYELPFGKGKRFLGSLSSSVASKVIEGWQTNGVIRIQSGLPFFFGGTGSQFQTFNQFGDGFLLNNITSKELQEAWQIRKTTGSDGKGIVYYLPDSLIANTQAAFNVGGKTPADLDKTKPYLSPAGSGSVGWNGYVYRNWNRFFDMSLSKRTRIMEEKTLEFRATALNVFNLTNFNAFSGVGATFGQVTGSYRDISGTVEPGGRILEFMLRFSF